MKREISKCYDILSSYKGQNNQILFYQYKVQKKRYVLSDFDIQYISENAEYTPFDVNKTVKISSDLGEALKEKYDLEFTPQKLLITRVIGEMGKSYHCYAQYRKSVPPTLMYIKKRCILNPLVDEPELTDIEVDFDKYDKITAKIGRKVKDVQKKGVKFLLMNKHCILADSMGLGKSMTSIIAAMESNAKRILIICPASLKTNWKREICFYNKEEDITIINSNNWSCDTRFTIVNYDILSNFYEVPQETVYETKYDLEGHSYQEPVMVKNSTGKLVEKKRKTNKKSIVEKCLENSPMYQSHFDCVIIDEAHRLSNNTSIRYAVISDFLKRSKIPNVYLLTGTPLTNKPINLFHVLKLIDASVTYDYEYYVKRYCDGRKIHLKTGRDVLLTNGASHIDELSEKIKHVYIRRLLSEMNDMVNKTVLVKDYDLSEAQMKEYNKLWDEYVAAQEEQGNYDTEEYKQLVEGILVRQYLAKEMVENTIQIVDEKLEEGEKVIIVCTFQEEMDMFKKYYGKKCVMYNGKMSTKQKDKAQEEFMNNPKIKVFIGQIEAAGVGLTLTVSNFLIFNSYSWIAASNLQMQDRIYRLTQTKDVVCIYQIFNDSISRNMFDKVMRKEILMNETIKSDSEK